MEGDPLIKVKESLVYQMMMGSLQIDEILGARDPMVEEGIV